MPPPRPPDEPPPEPGPATPCIRQCCLDDADECIGCGRTLDEIRDWHSVDAAGRQAILDRASVRRDARRRRHDVGAG